jgi:hypothetical protein
MTLAPFDFEKSSFRGFPITGKPSAYRQMFLIPQFKKLKGFSA